MNASLGEFQVKDEYNIALWNMEGSFPDAVKLPG